MTPKQTTQYFNVDELRAWLKDKQISFDFTADAKITTPVHLAKLNPQKIKELELHIGAFLHESLFGSQPASSSQDEAKGPVTLPDGEPIE